MPIEEARGKVALEPGQSLMAWMRLCAGGTDLTDGVGVVDEDADEKAWKAWTMAEVARHNTADDAWMVVHGKVYVVTHYLRYHPGGVDTLVNAAGTDGTELFDKYHSWVNAPAILGACCVGRLASRDAVAPSGSDAMAGDEECPATGNGERHRRKITWDEDGIRTHDAERGVLFGACPCAVPCLAHAHSSSPPQRHSAT